ncbi:hypothetical protein GMDG_09042, partial [Pseudogymnoascus destructans 20631-21]
MEATDSSNIWTDKVPKGLRKDVMQLYHEAFPELQDICDIVNEKIMEPIRK